VLLPGGQLSSCTFERTAIQALSVFDLIQSVEKGDHMTDPASTHGLWADLHRPNLSPVEADFSIIGIPYDGAASSRKGTALGPERIRFWSTHLTPFSEDRTRLGEIRIADLGDIPVTDQERDFDLVRQKVASLPNVPILLGGDHSVTIPIFQGHIQRFEGKRLGVLWVDAHPDLCDVFTGSRLSHACVLRRGLEFGIKPEDVCLVGLRSWEDQEIDLIENGGLNVYTAADVAERGMKAVSQEVKKILSKCDAVHISLDIDCLDPAFAPGTGIPDSGGLTSREVITLIKSMQGLPLVGLDVVEVSPPIDPSEATVFAALKVIMEYIAVIVREKHK
jgi:agmatinase